MINFGESVEPQRANQEGMQNNKLKVVVAESSYEFRFH